MAEQTEIYFKPFDPAFRDNPYPHYGALLAGPPHIIDFHSVKVAFVARYADVTGVLRDHATFSNVGPPPPPQAYQGRLAGSRNLLGVDPPVHSGLRRLISRDFTPRRIRELEPRIRQIASEILDGAERTHQLDMVKDLANVLPVVVIAELLGVQPEMHGTFKEWSDKIVDAGNNLPGTPTPPDVVHTIDALTDYFEAEIEKRRKSPGADLVSALVQAHDEADALSSADLLNFVTLLLIAGNQTTTNLIGNGTLALMRHPDQLTLLREHRELLPRAIEEMLRYDSPVQAISRFLKATAEVGGREISAGTQALVVLAAANRDPAKFSEPEKFDITRDPNDHVAFGEGIHFCIGAPLARLEAATAFGTTLDRFRHLSLKGRDFTPKYKGTWGLRGLESLHSSRGASISGRRPQSYIWCPRGTSHRGTPSFLARASRAPRRPPEMNEIDLRVEVIMRWRTKPVPLLLVACIRVNPPETWRPASDHMRGPTGQPRMHGASTTTTAMVGLIPSPSRMCWTRRLRCWLMARWLRVSA